MRLSGIFDAQAGKVARDRDALGSRLFLSRRAAHQIRGRRWFWHDVELIVELPMNGDMTGQEDRL